MRYCSGMTNWNHLISDLENAGFTQSQIGASVNASQAHISDLKNGRTPEPKHLLGEKLIKFHSLQARRSVQVKRSARAKVLA